MPESQIPLIHLVCGSTGAGKTTYAIALDRKTEGRPLLYRRMDGGTVLDGRPQPIESAWAMARVERCMDRIWTTAREWLVRAACPACSIWASASASIAINSRSSRKIRGSRCSCIISTCPKPNAGAACKSRNDAKAGTYQLPFDVTREMFDFVEGIFEPPDATELADCNGIAISPQ
jgi:hypothetical protein